MRAACEKKFTCKDTAVNLVDDAHANDMQNISSAGESCSFGERTATQASLKRKKKHSSNEGTVNETSNIQCKKCKVYFFFIHIILIYFHVRFK